jgi:hypothetical protein
LKVSPTPLALCASVVCVVLAYHLRRRDRLSTENPEARLRFLCLATSIVAFIVPLHTYDLTFLAIFLGAVLCQGGGGVWWTLPGLSLCFRESNLAAITGLKSADTVYFDGSLIASIGLAAILTGSSVSMFAMLRQRKMRQPASLDLHAR